MTQSAFLFRINNSHGDDLVWEARLCFYEVICILLSGLYTAGASGSLHCVPEASLLLPSSQEEDGNYYTSWKHHEQKMQWQWQVLQVTTCYF